MRLITIMLSLFLCTNLVQGFCGERHLITDTAKHRTKIRHVLTSAEIQAGIKRHKDYFDDCFFTNKYTLAQRLKRYPYSKAVKIVAVSYPAWRYPDTSTKKIDDTVFKEGLNVKDGILNYSSLKEIKTLIIKQIKQLTNIIYNTDYKVHDFNGYRKGACLEPRNALIFYDKNGKIFDSIEVCFECLNSSSMTKKITIGTVCTQKYDLLKKFFIDLGIKYGTVTKEKTN